MPAGERAQAVAAEVGGNPHPLPANRSQEKRWTREIRERLAAWTRDVAALFLAEALQAFEARGEVRIEDADLLVCYAALNHPYRDRRLDNATMHIET